MKMEHGHVFRRNRRHLRISKEIKEEFPTVAEPVAEPEHSAPQDAQQGTDHSMERNPVLQGEDLGASSQSPQDIIHMPHTRSGRAVKRPAHLKDFV